MEASNLELFDFTQGYIECALWVDEEDLPKDFAWSDVSEADRASAKADCEQFVESNYGVLWQVSEDSGTSWAQHGRDFYLTRNLHGCGFWDRGYGLLGDYLTQQAHAAGAFDLSSYWKDEK